MNFKHFNLWVWLHLQWSKQMLALSYYQCDSCECRSIQKCWTGNSKPNRGWHYCWVWGGWHGFLNRTDLGKVSNKITIRFLLLWALVRSLYLNGAVIYGSGCRGTLLGCSSRAEAPVSSAAGSAVGWWPSADGPLWVLPSAVGSALPKISPRSCPLLRHRRHLMSGQCWAVSVAALLPSFRTPPKGHLGYSLPVGLAETFASTASLLSFSPAQPCSPQFPRSVDSENSLQ